LLPRGISAVNGPEQIITCRRKSDRRPQDREGDQQQSLDSFSNIHICLPYMSLFTPASDKDYQANAGLLYFQISIQE
jgi:hypothetical protein